MNVHELFQSPIPSASFPLILNTGLNPAFMYKTPVQEMKASMALCILWTSSWNKHRHIVPIEQNLCREGKKSLSFSCHKRIDGRHVAQGAIV